MKGVLAVAIVAVATPGFAQERTLSLEDAFRLALNHHENFRITAEALRRVRLLQDRAWALLLPTLRVEGNFTVYDQEIAINLGVQKFVIQPKNAFGGLGTFSMTLFDARSLPALRKTKIDAKSAEESTAFTQADILYEVARDYFGVLASQRLVEINKEAVKLNEEHLRDARARLAAGELIKLGVTRAEIEVVKAKRELTRAENALEAALAVLNFVIGAKGTYRLSRPGEPKLPPDNLEVLLSQAQRDRRDLVAANFDVESARKGLDTAYGAYYPTLNVLASGRASQVTGFQGKILNSWTVFTLGWTIFDGGTRYADVKEKHSLFREAILKQSLLSRSIERDVRTATLDLKTAEAALFASKKELELARENYAMVMARFRAGLATTIEAVDAANSLSTAEVSVLREELNRDTMRVNLLRSVGADPIAALAPGAMHGVAPQGLRVPNVEAAGGGGR
jgi:outer membrane protein TolC